MIYIWLWSPYTATRCYNQHSIVVHVSTFYSVDQYMLTVIVSESIVCCMSKMLAYSCCSSFSTPDCASTAVQRGRAWSAVLWCTPNSVTNASTWACIAQQLKHKLCPHKTRTKVVKQVSLSIFDTEATVL